MIIFVYIFIIVGIFTIDFTWLSTYLHSFTARNRSILTSSNSSSHGRLLYNELLILAQSKSLKSGTPEYKFFNGLINLILESSRNLGTPLIPIIGKLKKALLQDVKIENEIEKFLKNSLLTFFISVAITWGFLKYSSSMLKLELDLFTVVALIFWQLLGILSFPILFKKLVKAKLEIYNLFFEKIYIFDLCHMAGISSLEILKKCRFQDLNIKKGHRLSIYLDRLSILVDAKQRYGTQISHDLELLVDELWSHYQGDCEALKTNVTVVKFIWLCIFFLSTYLLSLYQIFAGMID